MKLKNIILATVGILVFFTGCEEVPSYFETEDNFVSIATFLDSNSVEFSSFIAVMEAANMRAALSAYNPDPNGNKYTLFLPSNAAFDAYFAASSAYTDINSLTTDTVFTRALARYHVVNRAISTNNFPLGALSDPSLTGDYLVIAYIEGVDSTYFKVNSQALVEFEDIEMTNGIVHVIDHVLEPITQSGYDWLRANSDYSIFADLLDLTEIRDTLGILTTDQVGNPINNIYSLLVEADSIYNKEGIYSVDDLVSKYGEGTTDFTNKQNPLNQFAAYHVLAESRFLADLFEGSNNYNTFASLPLQISTGLIIRVNTGVANFDSTFIKADSSYVYIDYLEIMVNESNIQTRNGPIHLINRVMEMYSPKRTRLQYEFYEDPVINLYRSYVGDHTFNEQSYFSKISWSGVEEILFIKSSSSSEKSNNKDYIEIDGDFLISYKVPKVLPGKYGFQIRVNSLSSKNATIQVFLDGRQIGGNLNLISGGSGTWPYKLYNMGIIEFGKYEEHTITIRSLIPGKLKWDYVRFESDLEEYGDN